MSDEKRCECCGQLMYEDGRSGVHKHYLNDLAQCEVINGPREERDPTPGRN